MAVGEAWIELSFWTLATSSFCVLATRSLQPFVVHTFELSENLFDHL